METELIIQGNNKDLKGIVNKCPLCGTKCILMFNDKAEIEGFWGYTHRNNLYIQEALPNMNKTEREFVKSGYCPHCQEILFLNGQTDRIYTIQKD